MVMRSWLLVLKVNQLWRASGRRVFKRYLIVTNTVCSGGLMALADVTAQSINRFSTVRSLRGIDGETGTAGSTGPAAAAAGEKHWFDWRRTLRMGAVGLGLGPLSHLWYLYLDALITSTRVGAVLSKIALDQIVAAPCFTYAFFAQTGALEGKSVDSVNQEFARKFWSLYAVDCTIWPLAQGVNFYFVPSTFRVMFVCGISYFWNIYLTHVKNKQTS